MADFNPYAAPDAPSPFHGTDSSSTFLAGRGARFLGALFDGLAVAAVSLPVQYALGFLDGFPDLQLDMGQMIASSVLGFGIWFAVQGYFLLKGQTLGKRVLKMRMVDYHTNEVPSLGRLVGLRYLPITAVTLIPGIGGLLALVDVLFIFGGEKRCVHDRIAGTKVILTLDEEP